MIMSSRICDRLIDRSHIVYPKLITEEERVQFLEIIDKNMSDVSSLNSKLNQKITPLPMEILKCMRLDFSEDANEEDEDNFEEISKYEFVLSQEICAKSVMLFKYKVDEKNEL